MTTEQQHHAQNNRAEASDAKSREEQMVVIERDADGKPTVWCDPEIVDLVRALNAGGVRTVASCSGHGHRPGFIALTDGRWLVLPRDDADRAAIEAIFPTDINGDRRAQPERVFELARQYMSALPEGSAISEAVQVDALAYALSTSHPEPTSAVQVTEAAKAGWNACRNGVYAVCEDMIEREYDSARGVPLRGLPTPSQEAHSKGFYAGGKDAAKRIAKAFNAFEAEDDDRFKEAVAGLSQSQPSVERSQLTMHRTRISGQIWGAWKDGPKPSVDAPYEAEEATFVRASAPQPDAKASGVEGWRCFHCDEVFTDEHAARLHFGVDEGATPTCLIKGSEGGLVEALRRAEKDAADAWFAIHNETTDAAKAFHAQAARHQEQLRAVEQVGYDRGIAGAKAHPQTLGLTTISTPPTEAGVEGDPITKFEAQRDRDHLRRGEGSPGPADADEAWATSRAERRRLLPGVLRANAFADQATQALLLIEAAAALEDRAVDDVVALVETWVEAVPIEDLLRWDNPATTPRHPAPEQFNTWLGYLTKVVARLHAAERDLRKAKRWRDHYWSLVEDYHKRLAAPPPKPEPATFVFKGKTYQLGPFVFEKNGYRRRRQIIRVPAQGERT